MSVIVIANGRNLLRTREQTVDPTTRKDIDEKGAICLDVTRLAQGPGAKGEED